MKFTIRLLLPSDGGLAHEVIKGSDLSPAIDSEQVLEECRKERQTQGLLCLSSGVPYALIVYNTATEGLISVTDFYSVNSDTGREAAEYMAKDLEGRVKIGGRTCVNLNIDESDLASQLMLSDRGWIATGCGDNHYTMAWRRGWG